MRGRAFIPPVLGVVVALAGCTHATAPKARLAGEILSIGGVLGLAAGGLLSGYTGHTADIMTSFSLISATGIGLYAAGELTDPQFGPAPESREHMHRRWAKILTERAGGAAREGNCKRVRRLEKRVDVYNREVHDFVFMRDPEILRCLEAGGSLAPVEGEAPSLPPGLDPGPVLLPPAPPAP
jgi:hypothetical protein